MARIDSQGNVLIDAGNVRGIDGTSRPNICHRGCKSIGQGLRHVSFVFWALAVVYLLSCVIGAFFDTTALLIAIVVLGWLLSLALHEWGHAVFAYQGGDSSVADQGYLSLDLLRYADPIMTFLVPLGLLVLGGVALPGAAVSIQTGNLRSKRWETAVSLAGPFMNVLFAVCISIAFHLISSIVGKQLLFNSALGLGLTLLAFFQIMATMLNLLPLPPLDGWGAVSPWLPNTCFLVRWMQNPYYAKSVNLVTFLLIYLGVQYIPGLMWLIRHLIAILRLDPYLLSKATTKFYSAFSLGF